ncbi:hypothetical protein BDW75DRAFT_234928 [Aspergillus navahoensis]
MLQHEVDELWRVLVSAASDPAFQNTICVFDALDECCTSHRERLIAKLEDLRRSTIANHKAWVKFLVTGCPNDDIQTIQELAESLGLSSNMQQQLEQQSFQMKHRTYLWLHLTRYIRDSLRPDEEMIRLLPPSVTAAYQRSSPAFHLAKQIHFEEMAMALGLAVSPKYGLAKDAGLDPTGLGQKMRRLCELFVFVQNSRIDLIHQTAKELPILFLSK